ncbi:MAG: metallophosphoesterase family protein, partial [Dongiaceae bacterium]
EEMLDSLLDQIQDDAKNKKAGRRLLIFLGDYIDRGGNSANVLRRLTQPLLPGFEQVALRGNHEQMMLNFLMGNGGDEWLFPPNGAGPTFASYGIDIRQEPEKLRRALKAAAPREAQNFLSGLPLYFSLGGYFFVHAGVNPNHPLDQQYEHDMLWIREPFLSSAQEYGALIVHGHTIAKEPQIRANRIGIDTGACAGGKLTALVLEGESRAFLQVD